MKMQNKQIVSTIVCLVVFTLTACTSKEQKHEEKLIAMVHESSKIFSKGDIEQYGNHYADDFVWDRASSPEPLSRSDFMAILQNITEGDPTVYHFQERVLVGGNFAFFDQCSFIWENPVTKTKYRTFHSDIIEFDDDAKFKVMTSSSDGASGPVALNQWEPTLPPPPLPGRRPWPLVEPEPTKLKPPEAQAELQSRWNRQDSAAMAKMLHEDAEILFSPLYDTVGRDAFSGWMQVMFDAFPDLSIQPTRTFDMGEGWIIDEVKMSGTNKGPYLGNDATGKSFSLRAAFAGRYDDDGLLVELRLYFDSMTIMNSLGLKPVEVAAQ